MSAHHEVEWDGTDAEARAQQQSAKSVLRHGPKNPLKETRKTQGQAIRAIKRAPRHKSKAQQAQMLEVAEELGGGAGGKIHTNTTRSNVRGNHDRRLAVLELIENPVAFVLLLVAVDSFANY